MAKRIILLLDGTWNDADVGPFDTNIVRLREIIARSLATKQATNCDPQWLGGNDSLGFERADRRMETFFVHKMGNFISTAKANPCRYRRQGQTCG